MVKKNWENPELNELSVASTREELCYCEAGEAEVASTLIDKKPGGGHPHKPGKPCPDKPVHKPVNPLPDGDENDWLVPLS